MSTIYRPPPLGVTKASSTGNGLKIATIIFGVIGFAVWGVSIGFMLGWEYSVGDYCTSGGAARIVYGWYISIPANVAMIYVTARIIFLITSRSFPSPVLLADLHESVARMVAFTVLSLTMWAVSLTWLVKSDCQKNSLYHACNYGFVVSALVAGLAGGLWTTVSAKFMDPTGAAKYNALPSPPPPPPQPQTHYNHAYAHYR